MCLSASRGAVRKPQTDQPSIFRSHAKIQKKKCLVNRGRQEAFTTFMPVALGSLVLPSTCGLKFPAGQDGSPGNPKP